MNPGRGLSPLNALAVRSLRPLGHASWNRAPVKAVRPGMIAALHHPLDELRDQQEVVTKCDRRARRS